MARRMPIDRTIPAADDLHALALALDAWQRDDAPLQLHAGDLGWHARLGAETTAAALRVWRRDERPVAIGLLDGPGLVRLGIAPEAHDDAELAARIADDAHDPDAGVLPEGPAAVEARGADALLAALAERGWTEDEPWVPLVRTLDVAIEAHGLRIETVGPESDAAVREARDAVVAASFGAPSGRAERWVALESSPVAARAHSLLGYDDAGEPVAAVTVWSAGPGRLGILEPMGVDPAHRGRGHGRAICLAAAAALQELGASSAAVATPSDNEGAVAAYRSAGFVAGPPSRDLLRP